MPIDPRDRARVRDQLRAVERQRDALKDTIRACDRRVSDLKRSIDQTLNDKRRAEQDLSRADSTIRDLRRQV